jgi:hypothetical protein
MAKTNETRTPEVKTGSKSHPGFYVFSTLTASNEYALWEPRKEGQRSGPHVKKKSVTILGGSNVINKQFVTPRGVLTHVTPEDMKLLENNRTFKQHYERGFLVVAEKRGEPNEVAKSMTKKDKSAQLEPADYKHKDNAPTTGKAT